MSLAEVTARCIKLHTPVCRVCPPSCFSASAVPLLLFRFSPALAPPLGPGLPAGEALPEGGTPAKARPKGGRLKVAALGRRKDVPGWMPQVARRVSGTRLSLPACPLLLGCIYNLMQPLVPPARGICF